MFNDAGISNDYSFIFYNLYKIQKNLNFTSNLDFKDTAYNLVCSQPSNNLNNHYTALNLFSLLKNDNISYSSNPYSLNNLLLKKFTKIYLNNISAQEFNTKINNNSNESFITDNYALNTDQFKTFR